MQLDHVHVCALTRQNPLVSVSFDQLGVIPFYTKL